MSIEQGDPSPGVQGFTPLIDKSDKISLEKMKNKNSNIPPRSKCKRGERNKNGGDQFRVHTHMVHLTYSQIHLDPKTIEEYFIKEKGMNFRFFSGVNEDAHQWKDDENENPHTHILIGVNKKIDTINKQYFDYQGHHPNIRSVKKPKDAYYIYMFYHRGKKVDPLGSRVEEPYYNLYQYGITENKKRKRYDIEGYVGAVKDQRREEDLFINFPKEYIRYSNVIKKYIAIYAEKEAERIQREWCRKVYVIIGPSGVGKTRYVEELYGMDNVYTAPFYKGNYFFGNSRFQKVLLINNYKGQLDYDYFNSMIDSYKFEIHYKGGFIYNQYEWIYITSIHRIEEWYTYQNNLDELYRRITEVIIMGDNGRIKEKIPKPKAHKLPPYEQTLPCMFKKITQASV